MTASIDHKQAFNWWVPHTLKKHDRIISMVRKQSAHFLKRTHKFGIEMPKTVVKEKDLDCKNGNNLWTNAITKEMKEVQKAFEILPDGKTAPISYQKIPCHMVFDVKMEDFKCKARLIAGGHKTDAPATITYASVISHETVSIALMLVALNNLQVKVGDVLNAYITTPCQEKVWTTLGLEFGPKASKNALVMRTLYGLKSAGAAFCAHLASFMHQMGYTLCKADPDLWNKAKTRPQDNVRYYAYILCYVDDILCMHHDAMSVLNWMNKYLKLKPTYLGDPDIYLGAKQKETQLPNGIWAWGLSPSNHVNQAIQNCQTHLTQKLNRHYKIPAKADNPFACDYCPDTDVKDPLDPECASFLQHLFGVMRWMVELGDTSVSAAHIRIRIRCSSQLP
jgi:hypothetical protein